MDAHFKPWRRYFARIFDFNLYYFLTRFFLSEVLYIHLSSTALNQWLISLIAFVLMILIEPFFLSKFATTPGKWILSLYVTNEKDEKLSYKAALKRSWNLFQYGYGFNIPLFNLYRLYKSYTTVDQGHLAPWDEDVKYENNQWVQRQTTYKVYNDSTKRTVLYLLMSLVLFSSLIFLLETRMPLPKYRGEVTAEMYVDNINAYVERGDFFENGYRMSKKGDWEAIESNLSYNLSAHELTETDGRLTKVTIRTDQPHTIDTYLMLRCFFLADQSNGSFPILKDEILYFFSNLQSKEETFGNYKFSVAVENKGQQEAFTYVIEKLR